MKCKCQEYSPINKSSGANLDVKTVDSGQARALALRQAGTVFGKVVENKILTAAGAPTKRHIGRMQNFIYRDCVDVLVVFKLPKDMLYQSGDYLAMWVARDIITWHLCTLIHVDRIVYLLTLRET